MGMQMGVSGHFYIRLWMMGVEMMLAEIKLMHMRRCTLLTSIH